MMRQSIQALLLLTVVFTTTLAAETISQHEPSLFDPYREPARPLAINSGWTARAQRAANTAPFTSLEAGQKPSSPAQLDPLGPVSPSNPQRLTQSFPSPIRQEDSGRIHSRWSPNRAHDQRLNAVQNDVRFYHQENHWATAVAVSGWDLQLRGLVMTKDNSASQSLVSNPSGSQLTTRDADLDTAGGFEASLSKQLANDKRVELVYWGLFTSGDSAELHEPTGGFESELDINGLSYGAGGTSLTDAVDAAQDIGLARGFQYHNLEMNWGGSTRSDQIELDYFAGFRFFKASEDLSLSMDEQQLASQGDNHLFGFQLGSLLHWQPSQQLEWHVGVKAGVFANAITLQTQFRSADGFVYAGDQSSPLNVDSSQTKDDVAMLGQIDLGFLYRCSDRCRITAGYRMVAVTGLALPANQLAQPLQNFTTSPQLQSNESILLHGAYMGLEYDF